MGETVSAGEKKIATLATEITAAAAEVSQLTGKVESARAKREEVEEELHDIQLKAGEARVRLETLVQRTSEELQLDLPARYAELTAEGKAYEPADMDWDAVATEIKDLRERIRLGIEQPQYASSLQGKSQAPGIDAAAAGGSRSREFKTLSGVRWSRGINRGRRKLHK